MIIVHLALASDWDAAQTSGEYRVSTIGATMDEVGFIHASTDEQVAATFERFYADVDEDLVVVVMDTDLAEESGTRVVFEDAGNGELFPHIFGPIRPSFVLRSDRVSVDELAATVRSQDMSAPISSFSDAYGPGGIMSSGSITFPASNVGSSLARSWFDEAIETSHSALLRYAQVLSDAAADLSDPGVVAAGTEAHRGLQGIGITHTRLTGGRVPSADDALYPGEAGGWDGDDNDSDDNYSDDDGFDDGDVSEEDHDAWHDELGEVDPDVSDQIPWRAPPEELPVTIARGDFLAEGSWGVIAVSRLDVYSTGVQVVIEWMIRRDGLNREEWDTRSRLLRWLRIDRSGGQVLPIAPADPYVARSHDTRATFSTMTTTGSKVIWVTPAPVVSDVSLWIPLPTVSERPVELIIDAGSIERALAGVRTVKPDPQYDGKHGVPRSES